MSRNLCRKHHKRYPCRSCRASHAGRVMTEKKRAANAAKASLAAKARWAKFRAAKQK